MVGRIVRPVPNNDRGKGRHQQYMPHFQVGDVNSHGESRRTFGWKTRREMHTLSSHETHFLYCCDWSPFVTDIREQYPLPLSATEAICHELGIAHPSSGGKLKPFTTDYVLTLKKDDIVWEVARSIKPAAALQEDAVLELAEVERRYHQSCDRDWGFITNLDIPPTLAANLKLIHPRYFLKQIHPLSEATVEHVHPYLMREFSKASRPMYEVTNRCDKRFHLEPGNSLTITYHLIANRRLPVNMMVPLNPSAPLSLLPAHLRSLQ